MNYDLNKKLEIDTKENVLLTRGLNYKGIINNICLKKLILNFCDNDKIVFIVPKENNENISIEVKDIIAIKNLNTFEIDSFMEIDGSLIVTGIGIFDNGISTFNLVKNDKYYEFKMKNLIDFLNDKSNEGWKPYMLS